MGRDGDRGGGRRGEESGEEGTVGEGPWEAGGPRNILVDQTRKPRDPSFTSSCYSLGWAGYLHPPPPPTKAAEQSRIQNL